VLDGVPFGQRRAERAGAPLPFDFDGAGTDRAAEAGVGEELMRVVAKARSAGVDPELALREAARHFADHVRDWEQSHS
jgi:XTP/dITP diphosphohydrolase